MEIELKFSKGGEVTPWGFRLVGGIDFEQPLVVVKVDENSIAEKTGLKVGDIITKINGDCVGELSHSEAQSLIISSGEKISLSIKRGTFIDLPGYINEELSDAEISSILKDQTGNTRMLQKTPDQIENLTGQERILTTSTNYNPIRGSKQKYSTFLQKPERAKPVPKKVQEERKILGEPYKVKIVKQKRKFPNSKKVSFEPDVGPSNTTEDTIAESEVSSIQDTESYIEDTNVVAQEDEELKIEEIEETSDNQEEQNINEADNEDVSIRSASPSSTSEARIEEIPETSLTLEEQLKAVQKQLLALSQLPTSIQATLAAVTQQLDQIVGSKNEDTIEEEDEEENVEEENRNEEHVENDTTSEKSGEISDNDDDATSSISEGRKRHNTEVDDEEVQSEIEQEIQVEEEEEKEPEISEEERLAKIREEELLAKKQKEMEEQRKLRDWASRPIILPGGRKWSDADDATPKPVHTSKMSDEKICSTLETYSEVIVGKTKGINFLKYTPPPKNLDYLQNSEVYRMVHDLEGPPHGVGSRSEKILSEQDYYQNKFAP